MTTTETSSHHLAAVMSAALKRLPGSPRPGDLAYLRSTRGELLDTLRDAVRTLQNLENQEEWQYYFVGSESSPAHDHEISSDRAVELREAKHGALFLVIDARNAGSGLDGVYSSGREIQEQELISHAFNSWREGNSNEIRILADQILKISRTRYGSLDGLSELDYLGRCETVDQILASCWRVGLWPIAPAPRHDLQERLQISSNLVRILAAKDTNGYQLPAVRLDMIGCDPSRPELFPIIQLLDTADRSSLRDAFTKHSLSEKFFVGNWDLRLLEATDLQGIELISWRKPNGEPNVWSGLVSGEQDTLEYPVDLHAASKTPDLTVRWKTAPRIIPRNEIAFEVTLKVGGAEPMAQHTVIAPGKDVISTKFRADEIELDSGGYFEAEIEISAHDISQSTEGFIIREGSTKRKTSTGRQDFRCVAEFLCRLSNSEIFDDAVRNSTSYAKVQRNQVELDCTSDNRSQRGRIHIPGLWSRIETQLLNSYETLGSFKATINSNGVLEPDSLMMTTSHLSDDPGLNALSKSWRRLSSKINAAGSFYCLNLAEHEETEEFIKAWTQLSQHQQKLFGSLNTLRIDQVDGSLLGVILLPVHPIRLAVRAYYDSFLRWAAYEHSSRPTAEEILRLARTITGGPFPALYPFPELDGSITILQAVDGLDLSSQLLLPPSTVDPVLHMRQIRKVWLDDQTENLTASPTERWKANRLGEEIAGIAGNTEIGTIFINSFGGGDGGAMIAALSSLNKVPTTAQKSSPPFLGEHEDSTANNYQLRLFPSNRTSEQSIDQLGGFLSDLWEIGRKSRTNLPEEFGWIFASKGSVDRYDPSYPLVWSKQESFRPNERDIAHVSVFFDLGISEIALSNQKNLKSLDIVTPIYGLAPSWIHQYTHEDGNAVWHDYVPTPTRHERFTRKQIDRRLEETLEACNLIVTEELGGNPETDWPVLKKTVRAEDLSLLRAAHEVSEKVVLLSSNAVDIYRNSLVGNQLDTYLVGELGGTQLASGSDGISAVRVRDILGAGFFGYLESQLGRVLDTKFQLSMLARLEETSGRATIRLTDRNEYATLAFSVASFSDAFRSGALNDLLPSRDQAIIIALQDLPEQLKSPVGLPSPAYEDLVIISARSNRTTLGINFVRVVRHTRIFDSTVGEITDFTQAVLGLESRWQKLLVDETNALASLAIRTDLANTMQRVVEGPQGVLLRDAVRQSFLRRIDGLRGMDSSRVVIDIGAPESYNFECQTLPVSGGAPLSYPTDDPRRLLVSIPDVLLLESTATGSNQARTTVESPDIPVPTHEDNMASISDSANSQAVLSSCVSEESTEVRKEKPSTSQSEQSLHRRTDQSPEYHAIASIETGHDDDTNPITALDQTEKIPLAPPVSGENFGEGQSTNDSKSLPESGPSTEAASFSEPRAEIGTSSRHIPAFWEPRTSSNPHLLISGQSGMGKTTALLNLAIELHESGVTPIVVSFHADIDEAATSAWGDQLAVSTIFQGRFNPLLLHKTEVAANPYSYIDSSFTVRDLFGAIFPGLGDLQLSQLRDAVQRTYEDYGWGDPTLTELRMPTLNDVHSRLKRTKDIDKNLMMRLDELFAYPGLFGEGQERSFLDFKVPVLLKLSGSKVETLQNAVVIFALQSMFNDMFRRGVQKSITHVIIIDEAHRLSRLKLLPEFAREARKYGIALLLASQRLSDFSDDLISNIGSLLFFRANEDDAKAAGKYLGSAAQSKAWSDQVKQLAPHTAIYKAGQAAALTLDVKAPRTMDL